MGSPAEQAWQRLLDETPAAARAVRHVRRALAARATDLAQWGVHPLRPENDCRNPAYGSPFPARQGWVCLSADPGIPETPMGGGPRPVFPGPPIIWPQIFFSAKGFSTLRFCGGWGVRLPPHHKPCPVQPWGAHSFWAG